MSPQLRELRTYLVRTLAHDGSERHVAGLAHLAYQIASVRLRQLIASGRLHLQSFHLSLDGLAFDCVAELFARDHSGQFTDLQDFFSDDRSPDALDDAELLHHFRSLVFTSVHDGLFRLYREHDPILARILRNLKLSLKQVSSARAEVRFGQPVLVCAGEGKRLEDRPLIPPERLEHELGRVLRSGEHTRRIVESVVTLLSSQNEYRRDFPLIDLALILKRIATKHETPVNHLINVEDELLQENIVGVVGRAGDQAIDTLRTRFVATAKMCEKDFESYASAIRDMLADTFVHNDGSEQSQVQYLQRYVKDLSWEDYRARHRSSFEYMVRTAKRIVQRELRELL